MNRDELIDQFIFTATLFEKRVKAQSKESLEGIKTLSTKATKTATKKVKTGTIQMLDKTKEGMEYLSSGITKAGSTISETARDTTQFISKRTKLLLNRLSKTKDEITESELVNYWKEFINGLPEYHQLVKAGKINEMNNVLEILDFHNEAISSLKKALEELKNERQK